MDKIFDKISPIIHWIKGNLRFFGLPLVYISIVLLGLFYLFGLTNHNLALLPTLLIPVGIFVHVYQEKHEGNY